jgi:hypothetical protein
MLDHAFHMSSNVAPFQFKQTKYSPTMVSQSCITVPAPAAPGVPDATTQRQQSHEGYSYARPVPEHPHPSKFSLQP